MLSHKVFNNPKSAQETHYPLLFYKVENLSFSKNSIIGDANKAEIKLLIPLIVGLVSFCRLFNAIVSLEPSYTEAIYGASGHVS